MPVVAESSTSAEHIRLRRHRNQILSDSDSIPHIPSIIQSTRRKSTVSSLLLSTFSNTQTKSYANGSKSNDNRKKGSKHSGLRGFGCKAHPEVTVPAVIRMSAEWGEEKREMRNKKGGRSRERRKKGHQHNDGLIEGRSQNGSVGAQHVRCGPGIGGFHHATDAAAPVDFVVSTRPLSGRGKIDIDKVHRREIMMFQNGLPVAGRSDGFDRYRDWRLDVDHMSYEELLELGDRIGYVSTGLGDDEINRCICKAKLSLIADLSLYLPVEVDRKCSICQEEYEAEDEMGKLGCGHWYHMQCIKQWLSQKNACPVCKAVAACQRS
ncbi:hypothetical protein Ancab_038664 [Ancistrocladus abbreviatus]